MEEERERKTEETYTCVSLLNIKVFKSFQTKEQSVFYILEVEVRPIQKDFFFRTKALKFYKAITDNFNLFSKNTW